MGKSNISMAIFNSKLLVYQRVTQQQQQQQQEQWPSNTWLKIVDSTRWDVHPK
jgi:hypothetical protein